MELADEAAHSTLWSIEPNTDSKNIYVILFILRSPSMLSLNTHPKTIWLLLYVHLAFNLKQ